MATPLDLSHNEDAEDSLSSRLQWLMKSKGVNPNQIEAGIGITRQTLYAVLSGKTKNFTWAKLVQLSEYFGVRPEWLQSGEKPMYPALVLRDEETELVHNYRRMSPGHKRDLSEIAQRWGDEDEESEAARPISRQTRIPRQ